MNKAPFASVKAVLLDIDGTLIDSNDAHAQAWVDALSEAGIKVSFADVRTKIGMGGDHLLPAVSGLSEDSPQGEKISDRRGEIFREKYLPKLKAFPGARDLLKRFQENGIEMIVATSASEEDLHLLLEKAEVADLLEKKTSSADAEASKPEPDIIEAALKKTKVSRSEVRMIGDTPYDIEAAQKAGVQTIAVTCGGWPAEKLSGAVEVYQGPWELAETLKPLKPLSQKHSKDDLQG